MRHFFPYYAMEARRLFVSNKKRPAKPGVSLLVIGIRWL
ncbi:hypothetical protein GTCCBUS3UF5_7510 [Geobacillus thermoleovorans CCB_US3_UF5]|uniref:Uncharacterized protein n=2 Tax=Geobacillus thermoleovorans group TaxID=1505648 RepID=U2WSS5_GEOKU|nr:hypothetical protein GTCCBUS3UF5_7510 [Geobacillus thermoleovorans CCB_US3_UF5]GAD13791.1 hypothetical protein GBL_2008 [Geobacillus kaustophilus GBlys]GAJ60030.1 hypothetical protein B23_3256 [Geobacillus thermoleovorans B23]